MDEEELDFEGVSSSQLSHASKSTTASTSTTTNTDNTANHSQGSLSLSPSRGQQPRTKASRLKLQRAKEDQPWRELEQEITTKRNVRFSLSPEASEASSNKSKQRKRRKLTATTMPFEEALQHQQKHQHQHDAHSSQSSSPVSPASSVRGAGTDVFAIQDAGSYRMLHDETSYLCSTIQSAADPTAAAWELASVLSARKTRALLWTHSDMSTMDAILDVLATISPPTPCDMHFGIKGQEEYYDSQLTATDQLDDDWTLPSSQDTAARPRTKNGRLFKPPVKVRRLNATALDALAAVAHFISWDCTTSSQSASHSAGAARKLRSAILEHGGAMLGLTSLLLEDPTVRRLLHATATKTEVELTNVPLVPEAVNEEQSCKESSSVETETSKGDPTSFGRRNRKRRRIDLTTTTNDLNPIPEHGHLEESESKCGGQDDALSFASDMASCAVGKKRSYSSEDGSANSSTKTWDVLTKVQSKLVVGVENVVKHTCASGMGPSPGMLALEAMLRIVQGKEGDEDSCIDIADDEENNVMPIMNSNDDTAEDLFRQEEATNPLLVTNSLLRESGSLPRLARGMAETLTAVMVGLRAGPGPCSACILDLHNRLTLLASLIDGACCLSGANRDDLCSNGYLIGSILQFLDLVSDQVAGESSLIIHEENTSSIYEIALISIRTLTSLSHENAIAEEQLMKEYTMSSNEHEQLGAGVLADLLFRVVDSRISQALPVTGISSQLAYDTTIFCLNTLTNAIEAHGLLKALADHKVAKGSPPEEGFISWLSQWVVSQTESFRDGVMHGSFGKKTEKSAIESQESNGFLEKDADENLITAGNGFILLACCMIQSDMAHSSTVDLSHSIRAIIHGKMPRNADGSSTGFTLIKNTLKAFCNFYYYSVRDLSVAVVAPVKRLIGQLENMEHLEG